MTDSAPTELVGQVAVPVSQFALLRDKWVQKVTKGDLNGWTFVEFIAANAGYLQKYISELLRDKEVEGKAVDINLKDGTMPLYFVASNPPNGQPGPVRFGMNMGRYGNPSQNEKDDKKKEVGNLEFAYGEFEFEFEKTTFHVIRKDIPGSRLSGTIIVFIKGQNNQAPFSSLLKFLTEKYKIETPSEFIDVYSFNRSWMKTVVTRGRPISSVILPEKTKNHIMNDLEEFLDEETKQWFFNKGIPYKRSYLFYGVPGSGKTSLITAIGTEKKKPVCYLSPSEPSMTDDMLRRAISTAPAGAIIVLEDVDGLFTKNRAKKTPNGLTFSGLLNALDGVGSGFGQLFILTTNFRNKLDQALIRNGRVDLQVEFTYIAAKQIQQMFLFFYEEATEEAAKHFQEAVSAAMEKIPSKQTLTAAMLQNYFITHRKCTYQEAIDRIQDLADEVVEARKIGSDTSTTDLMYT